MSINNMLGYFYDNLYTVYVYIVYIFSQKLLKCLYFVQK